MRERYKQQIEDNRLVTEELLCGMKSKAYHNGDAIKVGDKILFGMFIEENANGTSDLHLVMINENQIDLYELDERHGGSTFIPVIKLK